MTSETEFWAIVDKSKYEFGNEKKKDRDLGWLEPK